MLGMPHYLKDANALKKKKKTTQKTTNRSNLFALTFIKSFHHQPQTFGLVVSNQSVPERELFQNLK